MHGDARRREDHDRHHHELRAGLLRDELQDKERILESSEDGQGSVVPLSSFFFSRLGFPPSFPVLFWVVPLPFRVNFKIARLAFFAFSSILRGINPFPLMVLTGHVGYGNESWGKGILGEVGSTLCIFNMGSFNYGKK